jgi:hypothetical protein
VFVLLKDAMFCAYAVLFKYLEIFKASALVFSESYWGSWLEYRWMVFSLNF